MPAPANLLAGIPAQLRDPLLEEYKNLTEGYAKGAWKAAALDGGRFCEVVYTILDGALSGNWAAGPEKPPRFVAACQALTQRPNTGKVGDYSLRVLIPRVLPGVYEIRNNRNVGHVGGDVVANKMDADFVRATATWVMCELVRVFHSVDTDDAQAAVDALTERRHPIVWEYDGFRRVLAPDLAASERTLLLLLGAAGWSEVGPLIQAVDYAASFRRDVLVPLAKKALVLFDDKNDRVVITPRGTAKAEGILSDLEAEAQAQRPRTKRRRRR